MANWWLMMFVQTEWWFSCWILWFTAPKNGTYLLSGTSPILLSGLFSAGPLGFDDCWRKAEMARGEWWLDGLNATGKSLNRSFEIYFSPWNMREGVHPQHCCLEPTKFETIGFLLGFSLVEDGWTMMALGISMISCTIFWDFNDETWGCAFSPRNIWPSMAWFVESRIWPSKIGVSPAFFP